MGTGSSKQNTPSLPQQQSSENQDLGGGKLTYQNKKLQRAITANEDSMKINFGLGKKKKANFSTKAIENQITAQDANLISRLLLNQYNFNCTIKKEQNYENQLDAESPTRSASIKKKTTRKMATIVKEIHVQTQSKNVFGRALERKKIEQLQKYQVNEEDEEQEHDPKLQSDAPSMIKLGKSQVTKKPEEQDIYKHPEVQKVLHHHVYLNYWSRGPYLNEYRKNNENLFIKDDKILIVEDDDDKKDQNKKKTDDDDILELLAQNITPTQYLLGNKKKLLEQIKLEEEKQIQEKKEKEAKRLLRNTELKITIYPSFDNFFKKVDETEGDENKK